MKITTWNVNQFCGNKFWRIPFLEKEQIWKDINKKIFNKIELFLQDENDLLFLNEVPTGEIFSKFQDECKKIGVVIIDAASDINDVGRKRPYKTIALFKGNNYTYAFGNNQDEYFDYMNDKFNREATFVNLKNGEEVAISGNDIGRVIVVKSVNTKRYYIGMHIPDSTYSVEGYKEKESFQQPKQFIKNLSKLVDYLIKNDNNNCEIVCCGDTNIGEISPKKEEFQKFLDDNSMVDVWREMGRDVNEFTYINKKTRIDKFLISKNLLNRINDIELDKEIELNGSNNNNVYLKLSDHYPISIEINKTK